VSAVAAYFANHDVAPASYRLSAGLETAVRDLFAHVLTHHPELLGRLIKKDDTEAAREAAIKADISAARVADIEAAREAIEEARAAGRSPRRAPK
jgi:hypothetical protein